MNTSKSRSLISHFGGFSLVEMMIVVALLGVLAAIAVPAYNGYIANTKRNAARAVLEQIPLLIENYRAENARMCPICTPTTNGGPFVYSYSEDASGNENTGGNRITAAYPDFKPKETSSSSSATLYHYTVSFTTAGCPASCQESAVATAIPQPSRGAPTGNIVGNTYR
jgi:prepilin-type N-terminal cleavage/methylation domain-containing protein